MILLSVLSFCWQMFCSWIWSLATSCASLSQLVPSGSGAQWVISTLFVGSRHASLHHKNGQRRDELSSSSWLLLLSLSLSFDAVETVSIFQEMTAKCDWTKHHHLRHISPFARWRWSQQQVATLPGCFCLRLQDGWIRRQRTCLVGEWPYFNVSVVFSRLSGKVENRCVMLVDGGYNSSTRAVFLLLGQVLHLLPSLCCGGAAGDFQSLGRHPEHLPSSCVNLRGSFLLSSCPACSLDPLRGVCLFVFGLQISLGPLVKSSGCLPETLGPVGLCPGRLPGVKLGLGPALDHLLGVSRSSFLQTTLLPLFLNHTYCFLWL